MVIMLFLFFLYIYLLECTLVNSRLIQDIY
jgi:hypothetical protein